MYEKGIINMLDSSPVSSAVVVDAEKPSDIRRTCSLLRPRCFLFLLVLATISFFVYYINVMDMTPDSPKWWMQYNGTKWLLALRSDRQHDLNVTNSGAGVPGFTSQVTTTARFINISTYNVLSKNVTTTHLHVGTPPTAQHVVVVQNKTKNSDQPPPTQVPYMSPGPYLVEYPYEYHFVINEPQKCEREKPFLVLIVPVAPHNRAHRDVIRKTWGGESPVQGKVLSVLFLLGLSTGDGAEKLKEQLLQESKEHQDLIQSDFLDCYKNLTIKTMVMLEWLNSFCSNASYAMKIDSDMFLNVPNLMNMLLNAPKKNYMTGLVAQRGLVLRDQNSKWYLPKELYANMFYPPYALGLGYVMSLDLPKKLVEASKHVKAVYIEDVYLGLCMQHLGITPTNPPNWGYFQVVPVQYSRCAFSKLIATTTHENFDRMWAWTDFKKPGPYC